jgi:hypothetical protein
MQRLLLNRNGIPTGEEERFPVFDLNLWQSDFNDCFAMREKNPSFILSGAGIRIAVEFVEGFRYA